MDAQVGHGSTVTGAGGLGAGALDFFTGLMGRFHSDWRRHPGGFHEERACGAQDFAAVAVSEEDEGIEAGEVLNDAAGDAAEEVVDRRGTSVADAPAGAKAK